jgi:uncharacterized protein with HEPN domain
MTRDRESFLFDIHDSARFLLEFTKNENFNRYQKDRAFRRAIERELQIIGEAMLQLTKLDPALAARIGESERIIGFRHVLVHGYFELKPDAVWAILKNKLSILIREVGDLLKAAGYPPNGEEDHHES